MLILLVDTDDCVPVVFVWEETIIPGHSNTLVIFPT